MVKLKDQWEIGEIILEREDDKLFTSFPSSIILQDDGSWKIWYSSISVQHAPYNFGYATGRLGEKFQKKKMEISKNKVSSGLNIIGIPEQWGIVQPIWIQLPSGKERIYFWAHGKGVVRFFAADSKDKINFYVKDAARPCLYHPNDRAVSVNTLNSASLTLYDHGQRTRPADEPEAPIDMLCNDATTVYLLDDGTFELYTIKLLTTDKNHRAYLEHDPGKGVFRVIERRTSVDGINWSAGQTILEPDEKDPYDLQFYYLAVTHTPTGRIGTLGYYRADKGTMDIEFCFSKDGISWERPCRGAGFPREQGIESIYAPCSMVQKHGKYYLFNTFHNFTHHECRDIRKKYNSKIIACTINSELLNTQLNKNLIMSYA